MTERVTEAAQRAGEQTAATAQLIAEQAAATAAAGAERVREASTALADAAKERAPQVAQRVAEVRERVPQVSQRVADVARERAPQVSQKVAEVAKERVPQATQRVTDEVVPTLRDVAFHAASLAVDLWQAARDRAADAADVAQSEIGHQAAEAVATGSERAREATAAVAARVADVEERAKEASAAVVERASEATERAKTATKHAASATVETGKETGAMLFWAGAAAGILFYALLDKNRREQLTKTVKSITAQAQELIKDFQGYDEELGASS